MTNVTYTCTFITKYYALKMHGLNGGGNGHMLGRPQLFKGRINDNLFQSLGEMDYKTPLYAYKNTLHSYILVINDLIQTCLIKYI